MAHSRSTGKPSLLRGTGLAVGALIGAFWLFFTLASHGTSESGVIEVLTFGAPILLLAISAWRWPIAGGALQVLLGLIYAGVVFNDLRDVQDLFVFFLLPGPLIIAGILVLLAECRRD